MKLLGDPLRGRTLLGRYRVVMPIGRGGMGTVYLARTEGAAGFARPVVIKSIHADLVGDDAMVQMFAREARLLANLQHNGIVNVLDFGQEEGTYIMVLEYVHGYDLGAWTRYLRETQDRLPFDFALHIAIQVLDTLQYTHTYRRSDGTDMTIVHRDISPGNILISLEGAVKLADFGIARATDEAGEYRSRVGTFKGKLAFSAPELVQGDRPTPQADLYSLGVVLLQVLLGENPFKGETMGETVQRVVSMPPPRVAELRPDIPAAFDDIIAQALAKDPRQRFTDAAELAAQLRKLRSRPVDEVETAFAEHVRADFEHALPKHLNLERLQNRDAAWRHAQDETEPNHVPGLRSTSPPPSPEELRARVAEVPTAVIERLERSIAVTVRPARRFTWVHSAIAALALVALGSGGLALTLALRQPEPPPPQFVVVPGPGREPSDLAAPRGSDPRPRAEAPDPATLLTQALHARQGQIQSCFERHVREVAGTPEIALRCQLDADGKVLKASLAPETLEATPLGQCLLEVARGTKFPAPGRPLSLRLPITARVAE